MIDTYVCLNDNQIELLSEIGFETNKIVKKYNFVPDEEASLTSVSVEGLPDRYVVYYGRIGEEKGIHALMAMWDRIADIPLVVMGGGPLEDEFGRWAETKDNVFYLGYTEHQKCLQIVKGAEFVVFPSIWYEGCSMVEIEAQSLGVGLVATDLGFSKEAILDGFNGYKVPLGNVDGFVDTIYKLWKKPGKCREIGLNARLDYEKKYLPEDNYRQLMQIYQMVMR